MKLKPVANKILIRLDEDKETVSAGGLHIFVASTDLIKHATVLAAGIGIYSTTGVLMPLEVNAGDRVIINKFAGTPIKSDDDTLRTITQDDIIAIIEE